MSNPLNLTPQQHADFLRLCNEVLRPVAQEQAAAMTRRRRLDVTAYAGIAQGVRTLAARVTGNREYEDPELHPLLPED